MKLGAADIITALVVIAFMMSPVDIINDAIPVLGQVDDTVVAVTGLLTTVARLRPKS